VLAAETLWTNIVTLKSLRRLEANRGVPFALKGAVTLVDRERNSFVLQAGEDAIIIHPETPISIKAGQSILLRGEGAPYVVKLQNYRFCVSGSDISTNLEAPANWGNFHLTRMAGYLHPPADGEYTFSIASDNSSELWLSPDENPNHVRNIASLRAGL